MQIKILKYIEEFDVFLSDTGYIEYPKDHYVPTRIVKCSVTGKNMLVNDKCCQYIDWLVYIHFKHDKIWDNKKVLDHKNKDLFDNNVDNIILTDNVTLWSGETVSVDKILKIREYHRRTLDSEIAIAHKFGLRAETVSIILYEDV